MSRLTGICHIIILEKAHAGGEAGGSKDQMRCKACNSLKSRINRMLKGNFPVGYRDLSPTERQQFMADGSDLKGDALSKHLNESVVKSQIKRQTIQFQSGGKFMDLTDAREKFKDKPIELENIEKNAVRHTCSVRGVEMVHIPEYSLTQTNTDESETLKKRKSEGTAKIKKAKKPKKEPADAAAADGAEGGNGPKEGEVKMVEVTKGQHLRLDKLVPTLSEKAMQLASTICEANGPEVTVLIPKFQIVKAENALKAINVYIEKLKKLKAAGTAAKGYTGETLGQYKELKIESDAIHTKLSDLVDDALIEKGAA